MRRAYRWAAAGLRVAGSLLLLGCASTPPAAAPATPNGSAPLTEDVDDTTPPDGANRLPASISCEPEPACDACLMVKGKPVRRGGSLDKEDIRGVVRSHLPEVKACYDATAERHPNARGQMMIRIGISASGSVKTSCLVRSELDDAAAERCVVELALGWTFPRPEGRGWVVVSYPFVFAR
jgi:hypothetical protein